MLEDDDWIEVTDLSESLMMDLAEAKRRASAAAEASDAQPTREWLEGYAAGLDAALRKLTAVIDLVEDRSVSEERPRARRGQ